MTTFFGSGLQHGGETVRRAPWCDNWDNDSPATYPAAMQVAAGLFPLASARIGRFGARAGAYFVYAGCSHPYRSALRAGEVGRNETSPRRCVAGGVFTHTRHRLSKPNPDSPSSRRVLTQPRATGGGCRIIFARAQATTSADDRTACPTMGGLRAGGFTLGDA